MIKKIILLAPLVLICCTMLYAQSRIVKGMVTDTGKRAVYPVQVTLMAGNDTLRTQTDTSGRFKFSGIKTMQFKLTMRGLGYFPFSKRFVFNTENELKLATIVLKIKPQMLKEVTVKGKIIPIVFKKDTIEYDALAYITHKYDRVSDLMKQLPGVDIDNEGNASTKGEKLTKIRVNGKDFFTGDVKQFISMLPADIVSKVQIINDYGDEAELTGVQLDKPSKLLNIVTKAGINGGFFGNATAKTGNDKSYGLGGTGYYWNGNTQYSAAADEAGGNTGNGTSKTKSITLSSSKDIGKLHSRSLYVYRGGGDSGSGKSFSEIFNEQGNIYTSSQTRNASGRDAHTLTYELRGGINRFDNIQFNTSTNFALNNSNFYAMQNQSGLSRQEIFTRNNITIKHFGFNETMVFNHRFSKTGRLVTIRSSFATNSGDQNNRQDDSTIYYNAASLMLLKDSITNRLIQNKFSSKKISNGFDYIEPVAKNATGSKSVVISFEDKIENGKTSTFTDQRDDKAAYLRVDSLSNSYYASETVNNLALAYVVDSDNFEYQLKMKISSDLRTVTYSDRPLRIKSRNQNVLPYANFVYHPSLSSIFNFNYESHVALPGLGQIQPLSDASNLKNIIIGNPNLKAATMHNIALGYRRDYAAGGYFHLTAQFKTTENLVVPNTTLVTDSLGGVKQITRFVNTNQNYEWGGEYFIGLPFDSTQKFTTDLHGEVNVLKTVFFTDNIKNFGRGFDFSQNLSFKMRTRRAELQFDAGYSFAKSPYSIAGIAAENIHKWSIRSGFLYHLNETLVGNVNISKETIKGYAIAPNSPLLINIGLEKKFLKIVEIKLDIHNLLAQDLSYVARSVLGNMVNDWEARQLKRTVQLTCVVRIDKFDKKKNKTVMK